MAERRNREIWRALASSSELQSNSTVSDAAGDLTDEVLAFAKEKLKLTDKTVSRWSLAYDYFFGPPIGGTQPTRAEDEIGGLEPDSPEARRAEVLRDAIEHSHPERTRRESIDNDHTPSGRDVTKIA